MRMPIALLALLLLGTGCGSESPASRTVPGILHVKQGTAVVLRGTTSLGVKTGEKQELEEGDVIKTGTESRAIVISGTQVQVLGPETETRLEKADETSGQPERMTLIQGLVNYLLPSSAGKKHRFEAATRHAVAAVQGTIFKLEVTEDRTELVVIRGEVTLRSANEADPGQAVPVSEGKRATCSGNEVQVDTVPPEKIEEMRTGLFMLRNEMGLDISTF